MILEDARTYLKRITYKPGTTISLWQTNANLSYQVVVSKQVTCVHSGDETTIHVSSDFIFNPITEDLLLQHVKIAIKELELHEVKEWLKLDGIQVDDPHPELGPFIKEAK